MTTDALVRVLLLAFAWLAGWWLCARVRRLPATVGDGPRVSAVVPARDEERALPTLLAGLAGQSVLPVETIVVDDDSSDATATVASGMGARVIAAPPVPDGWTGKVAAVHEGLDAASSDVVVVLDADVDPGPDLLARLGATFAAGDGLVSVQPYHRTSRWWERASAFFNLVAIMGTGLASPAWMRARSIATAFGPVLMGRRTALLAHLADPAVRGAVLDDVALARRFAASGAPVRTFAGVGVVEFRMYDRPSAFVDGWTKNFASGARSVPPIRLVAIVAWIAACLTTGSWVFGGSIVAIVAYVAFAVQCAVQLRQVGSYGVVTAALYPLHAVLFVVGFAISLVLTVRGEVHWKGRRVRVRARHGDA